MAERRLRLQGLRLGLWGRHDLYVVSLAKLLSHRGAQVKVLDDLEAAASGPSEDRVELMLVESPFPSDLRQMPAGPLPVIVLSEHSGISAGTGAHPRVSAVLEKNASVSELTQAILSALGGRKREPLGELTARQQQVLELIAEGLDNARIAAQLGISQRTARAHVSGVLERLGVENRTQAAVTAVRRGWIG